MDNVADLPMPEWMKDAHSKGLVQEVDDHCILWDIGEWKSSFSHSAWKLLLPRFETVKSWSEGGRISRSALLAAAAAIDPKDALTVHVGAMVWGVGDRKGRNRANVARGLTDTNAEPKMSGLCEAIRGGVSGIEIFSRLAKKDDLGLRGLGSSFATKTLYFMGFHPGDPSSPRPLILDMMVARALRETAPAFPSYPGFSRKWYTSYLQLAQRWASELGFPERPDVIEWLLFGHVRG